MCHAGHIVDIHGHLWLLTFRSLALLRLAYLRPLGLGLHITVAIAIDTATATATVNDTDITIAIAIAIASVAATTAAAAATATAAAATATAAATSIVIDIAIAAAAIALDGLNVGQRVLSQLRERYVLETRRLVGGVDDTTLWTQPLAVRQGLWLLDAPEVVGCWANIAAH